MNQDTTNQPIDDVISILHDIISQSSLPPSTRAALEYCLAKLMSDKELTANS